LMMAMEEVCQNICILLNLELVPPPMTSDSITFSINGQANVSHKKEWLCFRSLDHSSAKFIALEAPHFSSRETLITVFMNPDYMVGT
jgi:hypothetical protein